MRKKRTGHRRSDNRVTTKESAVLKHLRESRKLSTRQVADKLNMSGSWVCHAENGRSDLKPKVILQFLKIYGYSYSEFMELVRGDRKVPRNYYAECLEILKRLDKEKIKTVRAILDSL